MMKELFYCASNILNHQSARHSQSSRGDCHPKKDSPLHASHILRSQITYRNQAARLISEQWPWFLIMCNKKCTDYLRDPDYFAIPGTYEYKSRGNTVNTGFSYKSIFVKIISEGFKVTCSLQC